MKKVDYYSAIKEFDRKSEHNKSIIYYSVYSLVFVITAAAAFSWFWRNDKTLIWHFDGFWQHYSALAYYGVYLRDIVRELFSTGSLNIPMWDFSIGYGADIITTMHYYVLGDPLALLSIFVPVSKTELLYNFLIIFRLFLSGVTFSVYCREMGKGRFATLCGALVYVFFSYALHLGLRHPFFINPMIYLPLILLGVERIFAGKKPYLFIFMVFLSLASNFYFFYMLSVFMFLYAAVRFFFVFSENRIKNLVISLRNFIGYYLVGVLMACAIFIPVLVKFLATERVSAEMVVNLLYPTDYYPMLLNTFITNHSGGFSTFIGTSPITLAAVMLLFTRRKEHIQLKIGFILLSLFLLTPFMGFLFNGLSYVTNRWTFGYVFVVALILVEMIPNIFAATKRQLFIVSAFAFIYLTVCLQMERVRSSAFLASYSIFLLALLFMFGMNIYHHQKLGIKEGFEKFFHKRRGAYWGIISRNVPRFIVVAIVISGIVVMSGYRFSPNEGNYIAEFMNSGESFELYMNSSSSAVRDIDDDESFFRFEENASGGQRVVRNSAILNDVNSTTFFFSLSNGYIASYLQEIGFFSRDFQFTGLDNRAMPGTLASTKYFVVASGLEQYLPYGYNELASSSENFKVYKNDYALPLGYTYANVITRSDFEQMSFIERKQAMLQGAVLEENTTSLESAQPVFNHGIIVSEMEVSDGIECSDGKFVVTDTSATVTLSFEGLENSEIYVNFENIHFTPTHPLDTFSEENWSELGTLRQSLLSIRYNNWQGADTANITARLGNVSKITSLRTPEFSWYRDQHDFMVNLGYSEEAKGTITLSFGERGTYTFDGIDVICQPMDNFTQQVEALREDVLENVSVDTNTISGTIDLEESKLLALSIPFDDGWSAYVDGEEVELLSVNTMYMGIYLDSGSHEVLLMYSTPGLNIGIALSVLGFALFIGIIVLYRHHTKRNFYKKMKRES